MLTDARIRLYDTTLRDGAQMEGVSLSVEDKLKILRRLDDFGFHYVECGYPGSNPKDAEFFRRLPELELKSVVPVAFGSTRKAMIGTDKDRGLEDLLRAETRAVCIVGKTWELHVRTALRTQLDENLYMIADTVDFIKRQGREIAYDAEHFFDAYKSNARYAMETVRAAVEAGADWVCLCDTNGGTLPSEVREIVRAVREEISVPLGIHAHNDGECAVANSLVAVEEGATMVQGTINGYGERCGNANLCSIIPALALKMDLPVVSPDGLRGLTELSHFVSEIVNIKPDSHQPYVGQKAFAHKGGMHVSAVTREPETYEHIRPELVGNTQHIEVSELSGKSTIIIKGKELGRDLTRSPEKVQEILDAIKEMEHRGYHFEAADGSFELLMRRHLGMHKIFFRLESFRVIMEKREDGRVVTEATIKVHVRGKRIIATGEGNGPVNALDTALRLAIGRAYPELDDIDLNDYKVLILNPEKATAAVTRVLIESGDGEKSWGTIGLSENIIEASWEALVDSIEYGLLHKKAQPEK
ncbi:MAG: citramalate synthase [Actinomycetota bacterium]|nr:citramalate synthase [Actinomycetota bacterium]